MMSESIYSVTVIPSDSVIRVNGKSVYVTLDTNNIHAIQWHNGTGHIEFNDGTQNEQITDYALQIKPYVDMWEIEYSKQEEARIKAEAEELERYNSESARFDRLRVERNWRLSATDFYLMPDYDISESDKAAVMSYRQALRDLPSKDGAPWDGGGDETPWPTLVFNAAGYTVS